MNNSSRRTESSSEHYASDVSLPKADAYDVKISDARIWINDLWIRKRVCYSLHHSASQAHSARSSPMVTHRTNWVLTEVDVAKLQWTCHWASLNSNKVTSCQHTQRWNYLLYSSQYIQLSYMLKQHKSGTAQGTISIKTVMTTYCCLVYTSQVRDS